MSETPLHKIPMLYDPSYTPLAAKEAADRVFADKQALKVIDGQRLSISVLLAKNEELSKEQLK
jgi:hypothetical protein